jgi:hypothetical protein
MAKKVVLQVDVDASGAVKGVKQVEKKVEEIGKKADESAKIASNSFKEMATNMAKSLGIIGLIAGAINLIKDAFMSNQKVMDVFNAVMGTISTIIRDFFNFVFDNAGKVVDFFKQIFENPLESIKALGQAIVDNLIERFNSLLDTFGYLGEALSKLFSGDFSGAWESVKKAGKESIDIITGVNNTVDKTVEVINKATDAVTEYVKGVYDQNKALVEAQNQAKLAAAQQARLSEQYDREAELLRQRRDDERNSIVERIKANNDLKETLDKQEKAMLAAANAQVRAAQLNYNLNKTIDNQVALTQALANVDGVRAKIAGLRSEQQMNDLALNKEYNEMLKAQSQATAQLNVNANKFAADQIFNNIERIKAQRKALEQESVIELERLQNQINLSKEGTQARVDAEIEFNAKRQEIEQNLQLKDKELRDAEISRLNEINQIKLGLITDLFKRERAALELEYAEKYRLAYNDSQKLEALEKEKALKLRGIRQAEIMKYAQMTSDGLGVLMQINDAFDKKDEESARKRFKLNKALGIAQATINTFMAVNAALTAGGNPAKLATGIQFVEAGLALATGIANVIKIQQTKFEGGGAGATGGSGGGNLGSFSQGGGGQPPQGLTAQNTVTQLNPDGSVAGQGERNAAPMKAYVVESESRAVTERVNKLSNNSKIG